MNGRYEFSVETYPALRTFLEKCKTTLAPDSSNDWKTLLPKNERLLNQLQENEVILVQSSESICADEETSSVHSYAHQEVERTKIEDTARVLIEELSGNERNVDPVFNLNEPELAELFSHLGVNAAVNSDTISALAESLVANRMLEKERVLKHFCRHLLIKELKEKENMGKIFLTLLNSNASVVCAELAKYCANYSGENFPRALHENLKYLESEHRKMLLREFVLNCRKVEPCHFPVIECLVVGQADFGVLKKLFGLFSVSSIEYGTNKLFGKLVLHLLQQIGDQVYRFEADFQNIMTHHKSMFRGKIMKTYESNACNITHSTMTQIR